jgi:ribosomal protein L9
MHVILAWNAFARLGQMGDVVRVQRRLSPATSSCRRGKALRATDGQSRSRSRRSAPSSKPATSSAASPRRRPCAARLDGTSFDDRDPSRPARPGQLYGSVDAPRSSPRLLHAPQASRLI